MCKPRLKCSLGSLARLSTLSSSYLLTTSIYIFVLSSVYLVEYSLHQNLMIEIYTRNFDLHITVPSSNLAFFVQKPGLWALFNQINQAMSNNTISGSLYNFVFLHVMSNLIGNVFHWSWSTAIQSTTGSSHTSRSCEGFGPRPDEQTLWVNPSYIRTPRGR